MKTTFLLLMLTLAMSAHSEGNFSMIEINPRHGSEQSLFTDSSKRVYGAGEIGSMTDMNGKLYFVAQDSESNEELWASDGTSGGTIMVKDINPNGSSQIGNIQKVGSKLLFIAADNNNFDFDLFSSDGTEAGTIKVADLNLGWNDGLSPQRAAPLGNRLLFCTNTDLMSTDGTVAGTQSVLSIAAYAAPAQGYCELNGHAYFMLTNSLGKPEIWMTDGTTAGTQLALNLGMDTFHITSVQKLFAFGGKLYLSAYTGTGLNNGLFSFDGSVGGDLSHISIPGSIDEVPLSMVITNNRLFLTAYDSQMMHLNLYQMSAGDASAQIVGSVCSVPVMYSCGPSTANNAVYFVSEDMRQIYRVNTSDLSSDHVTLNGYYMPDYFSTDANFMVGAGGKIFFSAIDSLTNNQVFMESDGTDAGTMVVMPTSASTEHPFNFVSGCGTLNIFDFKMWNDKVVLPANFNEAGRELWFYEPQGLVNAIPAADDKSEVLLYPNPASNVLNLRFADASESKKMGVTNMNGELMIQKEVKGNTASIDVTTLSPGNYCLTFSTASNTITKRFVIAK